ncbi:MAG: Outer membrane protein transport protein (OMPP1/FadL/TodX) [Deltaproteobacteria bacterium ADurb.Bin510]|nr:MAG: Outer membrane protein transport protein (OMPP1/FadL/TodX) [Deltaproteobacteria bacterium ADurb.Bin510]
MSPRCSRTPEFDDTLNLRLGFEYRLNPRTSLMLGYAYQPSPVPDQSYKVTNYLDADKHMFSGGLSHSFRVPGLSQPAKLSASLMYQQLETVRVYKDGVQGKTWVDQESYELSGYALAGFTGLALSW